jgi:hypothetical protein
VEQHGVAQGLCGRGKDEQLSIGGQLDETSRVAPFDLADHRVADGKTEPARESCGVPGARQLEERQRVAMTLGDDLVAYRGIESAVHVVQQQRTCIAVTQPFN